jgi:monoamine oxidase
MVRPVDLAIVGAGTAGTFIADAVKQARPDWSIVLLERTNRVGGRLRSMALPGIEDRIELGGMRFPTNHRRVGALLRHLGLATHPFDRARGERSVLRGWIGDGPSDPRAGERYDLLAAERGRSAASLVEEAFERILPGAARMDAATFRERRSTAMYLGRRVIDWSLGNALATALSPEAHRFVSDAFGYDSGIRAFNAGDGIEFLLGGGDPTAIAVTPDDGMDAIPRALAARFVERGGDLRLARELISIEADGDGQRLRLDGAESLDASRTVLTVPIPALRLLARRSPALQGPAFERIFSSVEGFPAMKLYLWYDCPWWRPVISGLRTTTDLATRKTFYVDAAPDRPTALLAMYTDGRHVEPWLDFAGSASNGDPAPKPMLAEIQRILGAIHPEIPAIPEPTGSALMHWGADPHEIGWTFWSPGDVSDEIIALAPQPVPNMRIHIAGEAFSHHQSWTEGPLESAELVVDRILA